MKKTRQVPTVLKKPPEKIHPKTLIVASLTAITLAIISAKLTGLVSSLVLVGLASVLTAFISEFYRIALESARLALQKTVLKAVNLRVDELTGEMPIVTEDMPVVEEPEESGVSFKDFFRRLLTARWTIPILFLVVASSTVLASYVAGERGKPEFNVVQQIVEKKDISQAREDKIKRDAKAAAEQEAAEAEQSANDSILATREELQQRITELEEALATETKASETAEADATELRKLIAVLTRRIDALEKEQAQEKPAQSDDTTPPPTTDSDVNRTPGDQAQ